MMRFRIVKKLFCDSSTAFGFSKYSSQSAAEVVNKDVKYPPILDVTPAGLLRTKRQKFYDHVRSLPTVEEKQHAITSQRKPTLPVHYLPAVPVNYELPFFQQYITRTHLIRGLPQRLQEINVDEIFTDLEPHLLRSLGIQFINRWRSKTPLVQRIFNQLVSLFRIAFTGKQNYFQSSMFVPSPSIQSYWWHGDFVSKHDKFDEQNLCFQYNAYPEYTLTTKTPLVPIIPLDDPICSTADVPKHNYHPRIFGLAYGRRVHVVSLPGFWPGAPCEHPFISFHSTKRLDEWKSKMDHIETMVFPSFEDGFGIVSSFGWLMGIAMNQGFTPFHDITYPLVTQTILTDGQDWYFFVYQMNTICFHSDVDLKNKRNICWSSGKMRLYEAVENGVLKGVDNTVFKVLLKFFFNSPQMPEGVNLTPYLSTPTKSDEELDVIKDQLRNMFSNRPYHLAHRLEVPLWQHIYKWHPKAPPSPQINLQ